MEFQELSDKYILATQLANRAITQFSSPATPPGSKEPARRAAESQLREAELCVRQMESSILALPTAKEKAAGRTKVSQYSSDVLAIRRDLERAVEKAGQQELFGSQPLQPSGTATDSLVRGTQLLENSRRLVAESEEIGDHVTNDLEGQRHQLLNAHEKVTDMRQIAQDARNLLNSMGRREIQHKVILICIIIALFISIVLVVYYRFVKSS